MSFVQIITQFDVISVIMLFARFMDKMNEMFKTGYLILNNP